VERRKFVRIARSIEARYRRTGQPPSHTKLGWTQDIGEGGMQLRVGEPLAPGQEIRLVLRSSPTAMWSIEVNGVVVWQKQNADSLRELRLGRPTGIYFSSGPPPVAYNRIRQLLERSNPTEIQQEIGIVESPLEPVELLASAYDGSTVTYKVLRAFGWGPLNNLGYFQFPSPFSALNLLSKALLFKTLYLLPEAQEELVRQSARLLAIQKGDQVLDIACGRGKGSFVIASLYPESRVTAIDLLPENIRVASTLYATHNLKFRVDNAMDLEFANGSFHKVLCVEAAFHFPDRARFLNEVFRVLQKGGRLVVVDFVWKADEDRAIHSDEPTRFVKDIWKWNDFFSVREYLETATRAGFTVEACHNWSRRVAAPLEFVFKTVAQLGRNHWSRLALLRLNPLLRGMTDDDWDDFYQAAEAHDHVRKHIEYIALVLKSPSEGRATPS